MQKILPWLSFLFLLLPFGELSAQEMLIGDEHWPVRPEVQVPVRKKAGLRTTPPPPALSLPFFDDFSSYSAGLSPGEVGAYQGQEERKE